MSTPLGAESERSAVDSTRISLCYGLCPDCSKSVRSLPVWWSHKLHPSSAYTPPVLRADSAKKDRFRADSEAEFRFATPWQVLSLSPARAQDSTIKLCQCTLHGRVHHRLRGRVRHGVYRGVHRGLCRRVLCCYVKTLIGVLAEFNDRTCCTMESAAEWGELLRGYYIMVMSCT